MAQDFFCMVENATVENLVIDSSCLFGGEFVGALSAYYSGSLVIKNTTNKADVSGESVGAGGFVGTAKDETTAGAISLDGCVNEGMIFGRDAVGGLVGYLSGSTTVTVVNCINNGNVTSDSYGSGGLVGCIGENIDAGITISNCINNGVITANDGCAGGLVGYLYSNKNAFMTISNCTNNGIAIGFGSDAAGLFGT